MTPESPASKRLRDTACGWLDDPLGVVLDFETTGLDGYAVELAVTSMTGAALLHHRIYPGHGVVMHPKAEAVHGIRLDDLQMEPTLADLRLEVSRVLEGANVHAYNAPFDRSIWARESERLGDVAVGHPDEWRCIMRLYSEWVGGRDAPWIRLPGGDHTALGDCRAALAVLRKVAGR